MSQHTTSRAALEKFETDDAFLYWMPRLARFWAAQRLRDITGVIYNNAMDGERPDYAQAFWMTLLARVARIDLFQEAALGPIQDPSNPKPARR